MILLAHWLALCASARNERLDAERRRVGQPIPEVPTYREHTARTHMEAGRTQTIRQWARDLGVSEPTITRRLARTGDLLEPIDVFLFENRRDARGGGAAGQSRSRHRPDLSARRLHYRGAPRRDALPDQRLHL